MSETENIEEVNKSETDNAQKAKQKPKSTKQKAAEKASPGEGGDHVEEDEEDEAQKIMNTIVSMTTKVFRLFVSCFKFIIGLFKSAFGCVRSALGSVFGLAIFVFVAYFLRYFVIQEVEETDVPDFESKLKFLLRCEIWPVLPVFLAAAVGTVTKNELHAKFARQRFEQALLFLFNLLLLSTHLETECLTCVRACALVYAAFSMLLWSYLVYTKKSGQLLSRALTHFNFLVMGYNLHILLAQDTGLEYLFTEPTVAQVATQTETNSGWF